MKPPWDGCNLVVTRLMGVLKASIPLFINVTGKKARRGDHPHAPRCGRRHRGAQPHRSARRDVSAPGLQPQHDCGRRTDKRPLGLDHDLSLIKRKSGGRLRFIKWCNGAWFTCTKLVQSNLSPTHKGLTRARRQPCSHRRWCRGCCRTCWHRPARGWQHRLQPGRRPAWYWDDSPWQAPAYRHR